MKILRMISRLDYFEASHNEKSQTLEKSVQKLDLEKKNHSDRENTSYRDEIKKNEEMTHGSS